MKRRITINTLDATLTAGTAAERMQPALPKERTIMPVSLQSLGAGRPLALAWLVALAVVSATLAARAATFLSSAMPPTVDGADIANLGAQTGSDKWFFQSAN